MGADSHKGESVGADVPSGWLLRPFANEPGAIRAGAHSVKSVGADCVT